jgi:hypothetical protein
VQDMDITDGNTFSDEVNVDLDMLGALMLNGVGGEVDNVDVVMVDVSTIRQWGKELLEELSYPTSFRHVVGLGTVLSLDA